MPDSPSYRLLLDELRAFRDARDWGPFHTPKELAIAVATEAGELLECFLWEGTEEEEAQLKRSRGAIESEVADIAIYLLYLCDSLGIDLMETIWEKHKINVSRHPVDESRGRARRPRT